MERLISLKILKKAMGCVRCRQAHNAFYQGEQGSRLVEILVLL